MNLDLMLLIDKQFLNRPFYGVRQTTWHLQNEGHAVNEKRVRRLMRVRRENSVPNCFLTLLTADLTEAQYQQARKRAQNLPLSAGGGLRVERPNQVWYAGHHNLPMQRGFFHLVAIMD